MKNLLASANARALEYLESIQSRSVSPTEQAIANLKFLDTKLPEGRTDPEKVLQELDEIASPATMGIAGPRYF